MDKTNLIDAMDDGDVPTIPEFYKGRSIFLTGGTGFMGKVLIEKLLWSCPDLECIYILLRPKRGKDSHQRLVDLEKSMLFERLRERDPEFLLKKVKVINGDVMELGLGLSPEDRQLLIDTVSVIFHAAASVRFDDSLKEAVLMNARGSREVMFLSHEMKKLDVILHVSTTYCNTDKNPVYEQLYPPHADWRKTIEIAETMDDQVLRALTPKYINTLPNTYVFTKSLAEHVVNDLRRDVPTIIFRPSIVVSSVSEPMPGWIENFNGPVGLLVACGKGIMRSMCSVSDIKADYMAVDIAIKAMIVAVWKHGIEKQIEKDISVYNCCSSLVKDVTYNDIIQIGMGLVKTTPLNDILWVPGGGFTRNKILHFIKIIFLQLLPAFFVDLMLKFNGQKPILFKVQRKIYIASEALRFYVTHQWLFKNDKFLDLRTYILAPDREAFTYSFEDVDVNIFFANCLTGARRYLLNEPDETIPKARAHYKRMYVIDLVVKVIFWSILILILIKSTFVRSLLKETAFTLTGFNIFI